MKVEKTTQTKAVEIEKVSIRYSNSDIAELVIKDLQNLGYVVKTIRFETDYRTVYDEWGQNGHIESYFKGVVAEVEVEALEKQMPKPPEHKVHEIYPTLGKKYY